MISQGTIMMLHLTDLLNSQLCPFHAIGINAAAIVETPLSVANKLNCAAAFLVS